MNYITVIRARFVHPWILDDIKAIALQEELARKVITEDQLGDEVRIVAGVDVAYSKHDNRLFAAAVLLDAETLEVIETSSVEDVITFPYVPGLFSFRELPPIAKTLERLSHTPDLIICDGQGVAHPRRFGLASHLGVLYDVPTIGCSKTRLIGKFGVLGNRRGEFASLIDNGETVGRVLRTQDNVSPLYVSIGHRISLPTACKWIIQLTPNYRMPETSRLSDQVVRSLLRKS